MKRNGFTLIEVVIAIGILAIVSIASVNIVASILKSATKAQSAIDLEQTSNFVLQKFKADLETANFISTDGTNLTIRKGNGTSYSEVIYTIGVCNASTSPALKCLSRNSTQLTDSSSDPVTPAVPEKSAITIEQTGPTSGLIPYFTLITDTTGTYPIAVNIAMKFKKPIMPASTSQNYSAENILDTTIALGGLE